MGTTLLIPPPKATSERQASKTPHYIACLFTSLDYGKRVSPAEEILQNTGNALSDLAKQVTEMRDSGQDMGECRAVRINSGKFGVEWRRTKAVLEAGDLDIVIVSPEEENASAGNEGRANPCAPARAKAEGPMEELMRGAKRKLEKNRDGNCDDECEQLKEIKLAPLRPGIAKRRKKLGFDG